MKPIKKTLAVKVIEFNMKEHITKTMWLQFVPKGGIPSITLAIVGVQLWIRLKSKIAIIRLPKGIAINRISLIRLLQLTLTYSLFLSSIILNLSRTLGHVAFLMLTVIFFLFLRYLLNSFVWFFTL